MKSFTTRRIEFGSKEYQDELKLRDRILRKPIGLDLFAEDLSKEKYDIHIGAFNEHKLIGVLILTKTDDESIRMRQVAVDESLRGFGVGRKMVEYCELDAKEQGYKRIHLHARKAAVEFYFKLGYKAIGDEFTEVGITHQEMDKLLEQK